MSPAPTSTPCAGGPVELVRSDRKAGFEVLDAEMARDVEQHRPPDDAAREVVHAEAARAAGRGDQSGPVPVVQRVVAADVTEAVELGRCLQRHDDVVVRHLISRSAATAPEHAVAGREVVEMQRLGAVSARSRRTDGKRERESLAGPDEGGGRRDAIGRQQVRGPELIDLAEATPVARGARFGADDLAARRLGRTVDPNLRKGDRGRLSRSNGSSRPWGGAA